MEWKEACRLRLLWDFQGSIVPPCYGWKGGRMDLMIGIIIGFVLCCAVISKTEMEWAKRFYRKGYKQAEEDMKHTNPKANSQEDEKK